ncbi:MAG: AlpA family phage regulatory protein [Mailhella sp.]|nr:AlpA family phage regulatory protein [Mailhella sp.]
MSNAIPSIRIKDKEAAQILGIGRSTLWAWVKTRPNFPQPRRDGSRCTFWLRSEVEAYATGSSQEQEAACGA